MGIFYIPVKAFVFYVIGNFSFLITKKTLREDAHFAKKK